MYVLVTNTKIRVKHRVKTRRSQYFDRSLLISYGISLSDMRSNLYGNMDYNTTSFIVWFLILHSHYLSFNGATCVISHLVTVLACVVK